MICLKDFPDTNLSEQILRRKMWPWEMKWPPPYQNYSADPTVIFICMRRCIFDFWDPKCLLKLKWKNNNQRTHYFSSQSLRCVPQCYDYKDCCHLGYFVLFAGFYLYPAWLASIEPVGCFSFQFKKEAAFHLVVCLNLLQLSRLVVLQCACQRKQQHIFFSEKQHLKTGMNPLMVTCLNWGLQVRMAH